VVQRQVMLGVGHVDRAGVGQRGRRLGVLQIGQARQALEIVFSVQLLVELRRDGIPNVLLIGRFGRLALLGLYEVGVSYVPLVDCERRGVGSGDSVERVVVILVQIH